MSWRDDAACAGMAGPGGSPFDIFEGEGTGQPDRALADRRVAAALTVCSRCPVQTPCLADARAARVFGVVMGGVVFARTHLADSAARRARRLG